MTSCPRRYYYPYPPPYPSGRKSHTQVTLWDSFSFMIQSFSFTLKRSVPLSIRYIIRHQYVLPSIPSCGGAITLSVWLSRQRIPPPCFVSGRSEILMRTWSELWQSSESDSQETRLTCITSTPRGNNSCLH